MIVYAESSAVLAWLLGEADQEAVRAALAGAELVVTSRLTLIECPRALHRAVAAGRLTPKDALAAHRLLDDAAGQWTVMDMVGESMTRAARPFPAEPLRTLDAMHLASALVFHQALGALHVLSLDQRVRNNATELGIAALPA